MRLLRFDELQRRGIHAVAQTGRLRSIVEHVAQVRIASLAEHLVPLHAVAAVAFGEDILFGDRRPEAGSAGARFKLRIGFEQVVVATDTPIDSLLVIVPILAGEGPLGSFSPRDLVLLASQLLLPFGVRLDDLLAHKESFLRNRIELNLRSGRTAFGLRAFVCINGIKRKTDYQCKCNDRDRS